MLINIVPDGVEKLNLEITYTTYNEIDINGSDVGNAWLSSATTTYNTSNYCVVHINNEHVGEYGNLYLQETRHEEQSGYMHYYYDVKVYHLYVNDSDKGEDTLSDAMNKCFTTVHYNFNNIRIIAGDDVRITFTIDDASDYYCLGIVGFEFDAFPAGVYFYKMMRINSNGLGEFWLINTNSEEKTVSGGIDILAIRKGI